MQKCIIFGAGILGKRILRKLKEIYEVVAYADNNEKLWGAEVNGLRIISPSMLKEWSDIHVVICSDYYKQIAAQLREMEIPNILAVEPTGYMLYTYEQDGTFLPVELARENPRQPESTGRELKRILFVQSIPCIRTHKIATILKAKGIEVRLAYTGEHPAERHAGFVSVYSELYAVHSMHGLVELVNQSDVDLVHCSNEPDSLTNILLLTNKKIIHDTHDMMSLCREMDMDALTVEYIANVKSHGKIYASSSVMEYAIRKYKIRREEATVLENYVLQTLKPEECLPKLSAADGAMHCVYEGGVWPDPKSYRYLEEYWRKITDAHIHVHFYTAYDPIYCRKICEGNSYLHYEGHLEIAALITAMTQYDCGLVCFNLMPEYKYYHETTTLNKLFEYLAASLPVAVCDIQQHKNFVRKYKVGDFLDLEGDIYRRISSIASIKIDQDFLIENELTMDAKVLELIAFYNYILQR